MYISMRAPIRANIQWHPSSEYSEDP